LEGTRDTRYTGGIQTGECRHSFRPYALLSTGKEAPDMPRAAEIAAPAHRSVWHRCLFSHINFRGTFRFNVERYADVLVERAVGRGATKPGQ
jgi:hypothetical protein